MRFVDFLETGLELFRGGFAVAHLKLHRLSETARSSELEPAFLQIGAHDMADEKVSGFKFVDFLFDRQSCENATVSFGLPFIR